MVTRSQQMVSKGDLVALARKLHDGIPVNEPVPEDSGALLAYLRDIGKVLAPQDKPLFQMGDVALARKIQMDISGLTRGEQTAEQAVSTPAVQPKAPTHKVIKGKNPILDKILADDPVIPVGATPAKVGKKPAHKPEVKPLNRMEIFREIVAEGWTRKDMVAYMIARWEEQGGDTGLEKIADTRVSQYTGLLVTLGLGHWVGGKWVYDVK